MPGSESSGRKNNQQMKPFLVYDFLLHNSDKEHTVSASRIVDYLKQLGIDAERRSIYRDIDSINKCLWVLSKKSTFEALNKAIESGTFETEKTIIYDRTGKGFYIDNQGNCKTAAHIADAVSADDISHFQDGMINNSVSAKKRVQLQFSKSFYDIVVGKLGVENATYLQTDKLHFKVITEAEFNDQFLRWLLSFGTNVKIISPESLITKFVNYLDRIKDKYW